jgi:cellulose synthase/poly-beta-1,6-N-acetylglucosamine synthase-like glycosyltransferase
MDINVIIPSYKRSHDLKGKNYFTMAKYCVPESQKDDYVKVLGENRVITLPDSEDGDIVKKRNWILKNISRPLIMIDDDVKSINYYENRKGKNNGEHKNKELNKNILNDFFEHNFVLADDFGVKMWGLAQNEDNRICKEFLPFNLSNIVLGPFQAHLDHDLFFDKKVGTKDDYDMALQQLNKYKKVLRLNKFHYLCEHGDNKGGIVSYRSKEKEIEYCKNIMLKWGKKIIQYEIPPKKMTDLLNAKKVNVPIKGV